MNSKSKADPTILAAPGTKEWHQYLIDIAHVLAEEDKLGTYYKEVPWLETFLSTSVLKEPLGIASSQLSPAKIGFVKDPRTTAEKLRSFYADVVAVDLSRIVVQLLLDEGEADLRSCWTFIQQKILEPAATLRAVNEKTLEALEKSWAEVTEGKRGTLLDWVRLSTKDTSLLSSDGSLRHISGFVGTYSAKFEHIATEVAQTRYRDNDHLMRIIIEEAQKTWPNECEILKRELFSSLFRLGVVTRAGSDLPYNDFFSFTEMPLAHLFERNLWVFSQTTAGASGVFTLEKAFAALEQKVDERLGQWRVLYDEMDTLRATIDEQRQVITALEYRHVIEHLPDPKRLKGDFSTNWQRVWDELVVNELDLLVQGKHNNPRPLTPFFQDKVKKLTAKQIAALQAQIEYVKDLRLFEEGKSPKRPTKPIASSTAAASVATTTAPTSKTSSAASSGPGADPKLYKTWPWYERGRILFTTLSHSIHGYGEQYTIYDSNWPLIDRQILQALRPAVPADVAEVDWDAERTKRGL